MRDDGLAQLLCAADATAPPPPAAPVGLGDRVRRRRVVRNRSRRAALAAACLLIMLGVAASLVQPSRDRQLAQSPELEHAPPAERTEASLAQLDWQARLHERTAELLSASLATPRAVAEEPIDENRVLSELRQQRDRAALILVYEAEQAAREKRPADAIAAYRRAAELFPQSHWGEVARQRLKEMQT